MTSATSPNTVYIPSQLHIVLNAPILSSPPRRLPPNLRRRSRVRRSSSTRGKQLQVLPELSEVDESPYETETRQSENGNHSSPNDKRVRRRPRPVGITQLSDLSLSKELAVVRTSPEQQVMVRSPTPIFNSVEHSATLSFIAHYEDDDDREIGYQLDFPMPPTSTPSSRSSPTPSLESSGSASSESSPSSRAASPPWSNGQHIPFNNLPMESENWCDGLDDLWSEIDAMLEWDASSANFPPISPSWNIFPETPSPVKSRLALTPKSASSQPSPSFQHQSQSPREGYIRNSRYSIPEYPPPPPPVTQKQTVSCLEYDRPLPKTPLPTDVDSLSSPTVSMILSPSPMDTHEPSSRFSISTFDSPTSIKNRLSRTRSRSSTGTGSDSGCEQSTCSGCSSSTTGSGLRRKPIPIELFIR